jgi:hypothetical protein
MRPGGFNGLDLMVSLSNHGPHRLGSQMDGPAMTKSKRKP